MGQCVKVDPAVLAQAAANLSNGVDKLIEGVRVAAGATRPTTGDAACDDALRTFHTVWVESQLPETITSVNTYAASLDKAAAGYAKAERSAMRQAT